MARTQMELDGFNNKLWAAITQATSIVSTRDLAKACFQGVGDAEVALVMARMVEWQQKGLVSRGKAEKLRKGWRKGEKAEAMKRAVERGEDPKAVKPPPLHVTGWRYTGAKLSDLMTQPITSTSPAAEAARTKQPPPTVRVTYASPDAKRRYGP